MKNNVSSILVPFDLRVLFLYAFKNATVVEQALHQRFSACRVRGEWFRLSDEDIQKFCSICIALGGVEAGMDDDDDHGDLFDEFSVPDIEGDQESRILELLRQGKSISHILRYVFGVTGGVRFGPLADVVKSIDRKARNEKRI